MVGRSSCKLFVEGGGDREDLKTECRHAFSELLERAGFGGKMPRPVACGSRKNAYDQFCTAVDSGVKAVLLVDSEAPVTSHAKAAEPWTHVATRGGDGWKKPSSATDEQLHFMVQCMEAWFLADRAALAAFFGNGFHEKALPALTSDIEQVGKTDLFKKLNDATKSSKTKDPYDKGKHSFKLLAMIDPKKLRAASPWADRFFVALDALMD